VENLYSWFISALKFPKEDAEHYAAALVEDGFDDVQALLFDVLPEELVAMGVRSNHLTQIITAQARSRRASRRDTAGRDEDCTVASEIEEESRYYDIEVTQREGSTPEGGEQDDKDDWSEWVVCLTMGPGGNGSDIRSSPPFQVILPVETLILAGDRCRQVRQHKRRRSRWGQSGGAKTESPLLALELSSPAHPSPASLTIRRKEEADIVARCHISTGGQPLPPPRRLQALSCSPNLSPPLPQSSASASPLLSSRQPLRKNMLSAGQPDASELASRMSGSLSISDSFGPPEDSPLTMPDLADGKDAKPLEEWTTKDVVDWLGTLEALQAYLPRVYSLGVDGQRLCQCWGPAMFAAQGGSGEGGEVEKEGSEPLYPDSKAMRRLAEDLEMRFQAHRRFFMEELGQLLARNAERSDPASDWPKTVRGKRKRRPLQIDTMASKFAGWPRVSIGESARTSPSPLVASTSPANAYLKAKEEGFSFFGGSGSAFAKLSVNLGDQQNSRAVEEEGEQQLSPSTGGACGSGIGGGE